MIDLSKKVLPSTVTVGGREYTIYTDFQYALSALTLLKDNKIEVALSLMFSGNVPRDKNSALKALEEFLFPPRLLPREDGTETQGAPLLDYALDADLIYAAFYQCYGIRLVGSNLHWWEFLALLRGLKNTALNDVMEIRDYKPKQTDSAQERAQRIRLRAMWEIKPHLTDAEQKVIDDFNSKIE